MRLGSLFVTSLVWSPGRQHSSIENGSHQQMGASVSLRRLSPATITHYLVVLVFVWRIDWVGLVITSVSPNVTGPASSGWKAALQRHHRLQVESLPSGPCCSKLPFFCIIGIPPFCVYLWGIFVFFGCWSDTDSAWNQLSNFSSVSLMLFMLLTSSCSSPTCCRMSFIWTYLFHAGLLPVHVTGEKTN